MLHEIRNVKQESGRGRRRWFESDGFDLVVWFEPAGDVSGFQLCYDFGSGEHALTWRPAGGFSHHAVDAGDQTPLKNESPILVPDGVVPWKELLRTFRARSGSLEPSLRDLVGVELAQRAEARR